MQTAYQSLMDDPEFKKLKQEIVKKIQSRQQAVSCIRSSNPSLRETYKEVIQKFQQDRGRELFYPFIGTGLGLGPLVELQDGSVKYDLISGIGVHYLGHGHPELIDAQIDSLMGPVMHGNLQPGFLAKEITEKLLKLATPNTNLKHVWLTTCGTMANEIALKIIRQKKFPATRIFAFEDCFAGRSTAMQEITDNRAYREGQPLYGEVSYLPFYNPTISEEQNVNRVCSHFDYYYDRAPEKYAAVMLELVQGEGGFRFGTSSFYKQIFEHFKKRKLFIWIDEIQTFGRTGSAFAYQTFGLEKYVDVVTVAKALQTSAVIYTEELNPKPGLVAGTFTGSASALKSGCVVLDKMLDPEFFSEKGKFNENARYFIDKLNIIKKKLVNNEIQEIRALGGMIAFKVFSGSMAETKKFLLELFDQGVIAFYCGHDPYLVRILPPFAIMNKAQIDEVIEIIEKTIIKITNERGLA